MIGVLNCHDADTGSAASTLAPSTMPGASLTRGMSTGDNRTLIISKAWQLLTASHHMTSSTWCVSRLQRCASASLAITRPGGVALAACSASSSWNVLLPGAAHMSSTCRQACGPWLTCRPKARVSVESQALAAWANSKLGPRICDSQAVGGGRPPTLWCGCTSRNSGGTMDTASWRVMPPLSFSRFMNSCTCP